MGKAFLHQCNKDTTKLNAYNYIIQQSHSI